MLLLYPSKEEQKHIKQKEQIRNWQRSHPNKMKEAYKKWYKKHTKQKIETVKKYYSDNPGKYLEQERKRHITNPGKRKVKWQKYRKANPEKVRMRNRKNNARRRAELGFIPLNELFEGAVGHHINREEVIYIPETIHKAHHHSLKDIKSMTVINKIALNILIDYLSAPGRVKKRTETWQAHILHRYAEKRTKKKDIKSLIKDVKR